MWPCEEGGVWTHCRCEPFQETGQVSWVFRRPGPGVSAGSLHYGGSCHGGGGLWALACVWDGGHVRSRMLRSAYWDLAMGFECSGASSWEDWGQKPGAKGWGSSAWKCQSPFPMSEVSVFRACGEGIGDPIVAVASIHSLCRWALVIVVLRVRFQWVEAWDLRPVG